MHVGQENVAGLAYHADIILNVHGELEVIVPVPAFVAMVERVARFPHIVQPDHGLGTEKVFRQQETTGAPGPAYGDLGMTGAAPRIAPYSTGSQLVA
ncbi:MAG: hypothetical protein WEE89_00685 [Gemmatimonadota bacterium]